MKLTLALPILVALAAPAAASTITHSFNIRVTPTSMTVDSPSSSIELSAGDSRMGMFTSGSCIDMGGSGSYSCSASGLRLHEIKELVEQFGSTPIGVPISPVTGRISFDGTGHIGCSEGLSALILACNQTGRTGPVPDLLPPYEWTIVSNSDEAGFDIFAADGYSVIEHIYGSGAYRVSDWLEEFEIGGLLFDTGPGYTLTSSIEILLDAAQPGTLPSPVPLPASLPLLAGALSAAAAAGRKRRVSRR